MNGYTPPFIPLEGDRPATTPPATLAEQIRASTERVARLNHRWRLFWFHAESPDDVYDAELAYENLEKEQKVLDALLVQVVNAAT